MSDENKTLDPKEAPVGFIAVLKLQAQTPNICDSCDWRSECCSSDTDFTNPNHRCMPDPLNHQSGIVVARKDGCSVYFKKTEDDGDMTIMTEEAYLRIHPDFRSVWTTERPDWKDWDSIREQYIGKRTMMVSKGGGSSLAIEGISFLII